MDLRASPIADDTLQAIIARVTNDRSPALQFCSLVTGDPVVCNPAAVRFTATQELHSWDVILDGKDSARWNRRLDEARRVEASFSGMFRLRRFDNAVRRFVISAEPHFCGGGNFLCHLVSALEINDADDVFGLSATVEDSASGAALELHQNLVSSATVIVSTADIIEGVAELTNTDHLLRLASRELSTAGSGTLDAIEGAESLWPPIESGHFYARPVSRESQEVFYS